MQEKLLKYASIFIVLFSIGAMTGMVYYGMQREIIYLHASTSEEGLVEELQNESLQSEIKLEVVKNGEMADHLTIPLEETIQQSKVQVENNYLYRQLIFKIEGEYEYFYQTAIMEDNQDYVSVAYHFTSEGYTYLIFQLNEMYEHVVTYKNNTILVNFYYPNELYENIIVIDPAYGLEEEAGGLFESNEEDIVLAVALALKEKLGTTDYKVYYTRTSEDAISDELRLQFINSSMADMAIRIEVDQQEDTAVYGATAIYNDEYFIPEFNSITLSDQILKSVAQTTGTQALGLVKATLEEDPIVIGATVPMTTIKIGCISNDWERNLLEDEGYINLVAEGILKGIQSAYVMTEEQE
ncbi:MAG: N-acetylmuramoyl-L-alanine amidase [Eubacteriales bacterium]